MKNKLVISLLAILVLVLGVFAYVMSQSNMGSTKNYEREIQRVEEVSDSDEAETIEEDLNNTDYDNIDAEISLIEAELN